MSFRAFINTALSDDRILIPFVWAVLLATSAFAYPPPISIEWQELFFSFYYIGQAYIIAYVFADRFLRKDRYATFIGLSVLLILICAFFSEYVVETYVLRDAIVWWGVYWEAAEATIATLILLAGRLILNRRETERKLEQLGRSAAEAELKYLKAQINPHMLFNALNNIYSSALKNSERTPGLILKFSDILRYAVYECSDETVLLENEISYLKDFIDIQKLAFGEKGLVEFAVIGDPRNHRIPPFLLIPYIENCFKHGMESIAQEIKIDIKLTIEKNGLLLECENNYQEIQTIQNRNVPTNGLGLENVRRRLDLLFGDSYDLVIRKANDVFCVRLRLPIL